MTNEGNHEAFSSGDWNSRSVVGRGVSDGAIGSTRGGRGRTAWSVVTRDAGEGSSQAGVRSDRNLAARRRAEQRLPVHTARRDQADRGGTGSVRRLRESAQSGEGLPRRYRAMLAR